jgi:hypothetical protein
MFELRYDAVQKYQNLLEVLRYAEREFERARVERRGLKSAQSQKRELKKI